MGRKPKPPEAGPRDKDQFNFTDPDSRIMKNCTNEGVDQHYNVQAATDQESLLIVAHALSNHPNDKQERKFWGFANALCVVCWLRLESGVWCVWRSISNACIPCISPRG
jgi:hypothetical protein